MKVLVTGATGFLGSHLVKALLKEGHAVVILKRSFSDTRRINDVLSDISAYNIDISGLEQPFHEHGKIDAIIHTATSYGRKEERAYNVFETNTAFPLRLLETATSFNTNAFLNTDTILYKYLNSYALSKKQFAEWGKQFADGGKIRFINIRLEHIYGPGDDDFKFTTHVIKSCINNVVELKFTPGEQKRDFIYIDDAVSAYLLLITNVDTVTDFSREYDLGCGKVVSIKEFIEAVHKLTNSSTKLVFGALPYREHEVMESKANIGPLIELGWQCKVGLIDGIVKTIMLV